VSKLISFVKKKTEEEVGFMVLEEDNYKSIKKSGNPIQL